MAMHPALEALHAGYARALRGCPAEAVESHPGNDSGRWNARQIVEHLMLTYRSSSAVFRERLAKGRPTQAKPSGLQRIQQFFVFRLGFFPAGRPAPPGVIPAAIADGPLDGDALCSRMQAELRAMDDLLILCEGEFGQKKFANHQVLGPISAEQWRIFHAVHGRHHLKQIARLGLPACSPPSSQEAEIPPQE